MRRGMIGSMGVLIVVVVVLTTVVEIAPAFAAVPAAPPKPTAIPLNGSAKVSWKAPANGGHPIRAYIVTPFIGTTAQAARTFNSSATSETVTGLANGTIYTFKVKARNSQGTSSSSPASNAVKIGVPAAPAKPLVDRGDTVVRVSWKKPSDNGAAITGYVVTPFIGSTAQPAHVFNSTALSQPIMGLMDGTAYTFKVRAKNSRGTGKLSAASMPVTPVAGPPLKLAMNATIGQQIVVDASGMTLYEYLFDADGTPTTSAVAGALRTAWPWATWAGSVTVGAGLTGSLAAGYVQSDGSRLLSYNGHLLYTWVSDTAPGQATGQCIEYFHVLDASGNPVAC
jgi:predicted lipoprotein with Yx(FWY)xxD motif